MPFEELRLNQFVSKGLVLHRINYGEKDRILTLLLNDKGKVRVLAKSVRSSKSKLAGGIELFSESTVGLAKSRSELYVLTSGRLDRHFGNIAKDLQRTMLGYELLKIINKLCEDGSGEDFYPILVSSLEGLDGVGIDKEVTELWFNVQVLHEIGSLPNLQTAPNGTDLEQANMYSFDYDTQCFAPNDRGSFTQNHIKLLRLILSTKNPRVLVQIENMAELVPATHKLSRQLIELHVQR